MSKKTVNQKNLEALGAERLAALVLDLCASDKEAKRRVRLELTYASGSAALVQEVRKRLTTIGRSKGFVDWSKCKAYVKDLDTQVRMIGDRIAPDDPAQAFELAWQFLTIAPSIEDRLEDRHHEVDDLCHDAVAVLGAVASRAALDPETLADLVFDVISGATAYQWSGLIQQLGPTLGGPGCARLLDRIKGFEAEKVPEDKLMKDRAIRLPGGGYGYALGKNWPAEQKARKIRDWRQQIADVAGDTDAFLKQLTPQELKQPGPAAQAAERLLKDGRAQEAVQILENARTGLPASVNLEVWDTVYVAALKALGRKDALHAYRWERFETLLSVTHLRDLLKAMPDFEDIEKEDAAKVHAAAFPVLESALAFFLEWPDREMAASLVIERAEELDGDRYDVLSGAASDLEAEHPLASVLCRRAMIGWTLEHARSSRYGHASRHLKSCEHVDRVLADYDGFPDHSEFVQELRKAHGRKSGFWSKLR